MYLWASTLRGPTDVIMGSAEPTHRRAAVVNDAGLVELHIVLISGMEEESVAISQSRGVLWVRNAPGTFGGSYRS